MNTDAIKRQGCRVLTLEAEAITNLIGRIDEQFVHACQLLLHCTGRIVVIGMGKSGHIGGKIAATLASTGSPAFFVHPGEASHGDLGMITRQDVVMALSNSGETAEILTLLPLLKRLQVPLVSLTGKPLSTLAQAATVNLHVGVEQEACPLDLAPTASTTAALAMGDALAVALLEQRGFTAQDFALSHPGGALGRRLLLTIAHIMHSGDQIPKVPATALLPEALLEMTRKGLGMTAVVTADNQVLGVFTDGDLRRTLDKTIDLHRTPITEVMTAHCKTITGTALAVEALQQMEQYHINGLLVVNEANQLQGALNMHDLLRAGVV